MIEQHGTLEISRSRLRHNLGLLRARLGARTRFCATIKANAYGHGVREIGGLLREEGVEWACVYSAREAMECGWTGKLLVLAPLVLNGAGLREGDAGLLRRVRVNVTDVETVQRLKSLLAAEDDLSPRDRMKVHVQVDAGLTRAGAEPEKALAIAREIGQSAELELEGVFAHFSHGDVAGHETVRRQVSVLQGVAERLRARWPQLIVHAQNSGGVWHLGDLGEGGAGLEMVRVGIAMYGLQPGALSGPDRIEGILPIARLVARVLAIHERPAGVGVGYGHTFVTRRASRLAIVPVGYGDGYPRAMSNPGGGGVVQIRDVEAPVVGRVSMDQIIVDVTDMRPEVRVGEQAVVMSWDAGARNSVDALAEAMGTIGYEVATGWGGRVERVMVDE